MQFANATYQAARWAREAEIAKGLLDAMARAEAESRFCAEDLGPDAVNGEGE